MIKNNVPAIGLPSGNDFLASLVVFLVALPLCMGIAIASGVPPALGLITGIVGGLVVGFLAGAPLQVSGPAAGLTVLVWQLVQDYGLPALGVAVFIAGALQYAAGWLGLGRWFRAVSPAVIHGMLAGIGVLIFTSQFHVMLDHGPKGSGLTNLFSIPEAVIGIFGSEGLTGGASHRLAAFTGVATILTLLVWGKLRPKRLRFVPAPLLAVVAGSGIAYFLGFDVKMVNVPDNLLDAATWLSWSRFRFVTEPGFLVEAVGLAFIASAETLLCATALDKMHKGPRTDYDKELRAQGIGNAICGAVGALPMTGVIVRSSANVDSGGKTRWSTIFHGAWLLALVVVFPHALERIPLSVLAAILVYTGYRLVNVASIRKLARYGRGELFIYFSTLIGIVVADLLTGVILGLILSMIKILLSVSRLRIREEHVDDALHIHLSGAATVLTLPKLAHALENVPSDRKVLIHVEALAIIDHACLELIEDFHLGRSGQSAHEVELDLGTLRERYRDPAYHVRESAA
ncbi:MAG: SulP family inorganic anion transporter [Acidobacteriota bacterium]|nr:MAG: SulP family inorganic anion transporter [Acidobacteriota bacterium]